MADKVSLFKCRHCSARMFERDCVRHLTQVHGRHIAEARILDHFTKGAKDTAAHPGADYKPMYHQKQAKGAKAPVKPGDPAEDDEDLN